MKIRSLLATASLLACSMSQAQSMVAVPEYSGAMQLSAPLILTAGQSSAFVATVRVGGTSKQSCHLFGNLWAMPQVHDFDKRILIVEQGSVSIACAGKPVQRVVGDFVHSPTEPAWEPLQKSICLVPGARNTCVSSGTQVDAGTYGGWNTWHVITDPAPQQSRPPK